jgi:hypothetical protein
MTPSLLKHTINSIPGLHDGLVSGRPCARRVLSDPIIGKFANPKNIEPGSREFQEGLGEDRVDRTLRRYCRQNSSRMLKTQCRVTEILHLKNRRITHPGVDCQNRMDGGTLPERVFSGRIP